MLNAPPKYIVLLKVSPWFPAGTLQFLEIQALLYRGYLNYLTYISTSSSRTNITSICAPLRSATKSGLRPGIGLGAFCSINEKIFLESFSLFISATIVTPLTKGVKEQL